MYLERTRAYAARIPSTSGNLHGNRFLLGHVSSQSLKDAATLLEAVTKVSITGASSDESYFCAQHRLDKRRTSDLTELMKVQTRQWLAFTNFQRLGDNFSCPRTFGYDGSRERMDQYLEKELDRIISENTRHDTNSSEKIAKRLPSSNVTTEHKEIRNKNSMDASIPIVWVIQPIVRNRKIKFKFSTDFGPSFFIRERELIQILETINCLCREKMGDSCCCMVFYHVFTIDLRFSRVVTSDAISSVIEEMAMMMTNNKMNTRFHSTNAARKIMKDKDETGLVSASAPINTIVTSSDRSGTKTRRSRSLVKRLTQYWDQRRLKRIVQQQVRIALLRAVAEST